MADLKDSRLLPNIPSSTQPTLPRGRLLHQMIRSINRNTVAATTPPRMSDQGQITAAQSLGLLAGDTDLGASNEDVNEPQRAGEYWTETERTTSTVRVENPEDATQYVDVDRIDTVTFIKTDGTVAVLTFDNT